MCRTSDYRLWKENSKPKVGSKENWEISSLKSRLTFSLLGSGYLLVSFPKQNHRVTGWSIQIFTRNNPKLFSQREQLNWTHWWQQLVKVPRNCHIEPLSNGMHCVVHSFSFLWSAASIRNIQFSSIKGEVLFLVLLNPKFLHHQSTLDTIQPADPRVWCLSSFSASPCSEMPFFFFFHLLRTTCLLVSLCTATAWGERTEKKRCLDAFSSPGMDTVMVLASWVWARILKQPGAFSNARCPLSPGIWNAEAYYLQRLQLLAPG